MWSRFAAKTVDGWVAVVRRTARLDVARVVRAAGGRPEIVALDSFQVEHDEAEALARLAQSKFLQKNQCVTLLGETEYRLVQVDAPTVPAEERVQALRWRLKDMVDFPVDTAALAVADIPTDAGRQASVFVVAAPASSVSECMTRYAQAKINLQAIDISEMAVRNVAVLFEQENRGLAFLLLSEDHSILVITYKGELYLSRRIDMTAEALSPEDSERRLAMRERLALELQRTLDNFDRQYGFISVSRLVVATEKDSAGLVAALGENLYLPLLAMDLSDVTDFSTLPELRQLERQAQGVLAIGAALRTKI
jgi:MSHA biogenesis protein MshI